MSDSAFKLDMEVCLSLCAHTQVVIIYSVYALYLLSPKTC